MFERSLSSWALERPSGLFASAARIVTSSSSSMIFRRVFSWSLGSDGHVQMPFIGLTGLYGLDKDSV